VAPVQATHTVVDALAGGSAGQTVAKASNQMPEGMATERVTGQQHEIREKDQGADPDTESAVEPERVPYIASENDKKKEGQVEKIPMNILHD
jgi:hypothetical protein